MPPPDRDGRDRGRPRGERLDERVVREGLADSRSAAQALILAGKVLVDVPEASLERRLPQIGAPLIDISGDLLSGRVGHHIVLGHPKGGRRGDQDGSSDAEDGRAEHSKKWVGKVDRHGS